MMKARKADADRLLVPIFRAFATTLGIGDRRLLVAPDGAKLWVAAKSDNPDHPFVYHMEEINPHLLAANGVNTMDSAIVYGRAAGKRAHAALKRCKVKAASNPPITDELPITFTADGRPYKILKMGVNPWVCWWHPDDQWVTLRPATFAEIDLAKRHRMAGHDAAAYDAIHEANVPSTWDGAASIRDRAHADDDAERQLTNRERAQAIRCPRCGALPDEPCSEPGKLRIGAGHTVKVHLERFRAIHNWGKTADKDPAEEASDKSVCK